MKPTFMFTLWCLFLAPLFLFSQQPVLVADLTAGTGSTFDEEGEKIMAAIGSRAIFRIKAPDGAWQAWASAGTAASTLLLEEFSGDAVFGEQIEVEGGLVFMVIQSQPEIWFTDGTPEGTRMLESLSPSIQRLAILGGDLYLETSEGFSNSRLLKYSFQNDAVETVYTFPSRNGILDMEVLNDSTLILLAGSEEGRSLFISDGTTAGTQPYYLINDGSEFSQFTLMSRAGDKVYFFYKFPVTGGGYFLYATDGTIDGTEQIQEFGFNTNSGSYEEKRSVYAWQGKFFFNGWPLGVPGNNHRLFVSNGSPEGTFALDPDPSEYLRPAWMTEYNGLLYFQGDFCCYTFGVFRTDGTLEGTEEVLTGNGLGGGGSFGGSGLAVFDGLLYFSAYRTETGEELWASDGTVAGTAAVELVPGEGNSFPENLLVADSLLFFIAEKPATGKELFVLGIEPSCVSVTNELSATICEGEAFELGNNSYTTSGNYEAVLVTPEGCDSTILLNLQVEPLPEISLGPDKVITQNEVLVFDLGDGYASQEWSDGSTGTSFVFVASDFGLGEFTINVRVVDENGCENTDEMLVTVVMESGVSNQAKARPSLILMPNPVHAGQTVRLDLPKLPHVENGMQLQVYRMDAGLVWEEMLMPVNKEQGKWELEAPLVPGVYFLRLVLNGEPVATEKLMVF